jgi:hypothetical protein
MKIFSKLLFLCVLGISWQSFSGVYDKSNNGLESIVTKLKIEQGIASFTQKKHFTFLANPIVSKGILKIYQNSVIWQVQSPVFSKLVIIEDQVWQFVSDSQNNYYKAVASHASIETLIRAVFTGKINKAQWDISIDEQQCLQLLPKDLILSQAITQITVCVSDKKEQRFVAIKDAQNNLTEIELNIMTDQLSSEDIREFNIKK